VLDAPGRLTIVTWYSGAVNIYSWGNEVAYTDKKENKIFLIHKEIQNGAVTTSYMRKGCLIYEEMRTYLVIYEEVVNHFATAPFRISLNIWKIRFFFYQCM
jgi:hypothetical protein